MKSKKSISIIVALGLSIFNPLFSQEVFFADYDAATIGGTGNVAVTDHSGTLTINQNQFYPGKCILTETPLAVTGRPGNGVIRFECKQSDGNYASTKGNRAELKYKSQTCNSSNNEPTEIWYAWSLYIPNPGTGVEKWVGNDNAYGNPKDAGDGGGREIYMQVHAPDGINLDGNTENPPLAFYRKPNSNNPNVGMFTLTWRWNINAANESKGVPISIELGEWSDYVMRVVWSNSTLNNGAIELWKNGVKIVTDTTTRVGYRNMVTSYLKQGIYAFDWNSNIATDAYTAVAYYDEMKIYEGHTTYEFMKPRRTNNSSDNQAPTVPTTLTSSNIGSTGFTLNWNASSDNVGVIGYDIYLNGVLKSSSATTSVAITGLTSSSTFIATVKAKDAAGNISNESSPLTVATVFGCGVPVPWTSFQIAPQTSTFTAEFDATPASDNMDGLVGFSTSTPSGSLYSLIACATQFKTNIFARNASAYVAENVLAYTAGNKYHVKMVINVATRKYDVFVTPQGGTEVIIGTNYSFRTEQASVTSLNYFSIITQDCNLKLENLVVAGTAISTGLSNNNITDIDKNFRLYPNPLTQNGDLTIDFGEKLEKANLEIFDINGKMVYSRSIENASKMNLMTNGVLNKGFYLVKVSDSQNSINQKLIVK